MNSDKLIYAVDDEQSIREVYEFALSGAGYEPRCFSCWEELSAALKAHGVTMAYDGLTVEI